jgi:hypothetical protein
MACALAKTGIYDTVSCSKVQFFQVKPPKVQDRFRNHSTKTRCAILWSEPRKIALKIPQVFTDGLKVNVLARQTPLPQFFPF